MACMFGAYAIWYVNGKNAAADYLNDRKSVCLCLSGLCSCKVLNKRISQTIKKVLEQAREDHKAVVKERIAHISKINELVDVTKHLYGMSKEVAQMEAQVYELQQKAAFSADIKGTLDAWVRYEAGVRDAEQKQLVASVIEKIQAELADPKVVRIYPAFITYENTHRGCKYSNKPF